MARVTIENLTQRRVYVPVPIGLSLRPRQRVILSGVNDSELAASLKISQLIQKQVVRIAIDPNDPNIDDSLEQRYISPPGGIPVHGSSHDAGGADPVDIENLRASGGLPDQILTATGSGTVQFRNPTVATHNATHQHGGADEVAVDTPAVRAIPKALATGKLASGWIDTGVTPGQIAAADDPRMPTSGEKSALAGTSGVPGPTNRYVTDSDPRVVGAGSVPAHETTHRKGGSDSLDAGNLETFSAPGSGYILAADGAGNASWSTPTAPGAHGGTHESGGADQIGTATPTANAIPYADATGKFADGWISETSVTQHEAAIDHDQLTNYAVGQHRVINDSGASSTELWSASKISSELSAVTAGLDVKAGVDTSTTGLGNITLSAEQTLNGLLTSTSRVLVTEQTLPQQNGIYVTAAGAWARATDADDDAEVTNGNIVHVVNSGSDKYKFKYLLVTPDPITVGTTGQTWEEHRDIDFGTTAGTATEGNDSRVPTQDENDALQGTDGTPSNANRYVTNSDSRLSDARTPTSHATTHQHGGTDETATATPAANAIPKADGSGALNSWITPAAPAQGIGGGNQEGSATSFSRSDHDHTVRETGGPTDLTVGAVPEGYSVRRSGTSLAGVNPYDPARTIVVATTALGADATSIADGITAANALTPSASAPVTILVHPGVYSTAPFTLPNYVSLTGIGHAETTILDATTTTAALCTVGGSHTVRGFTFRDANGSGGIGIAAGSLSATTEPVVEHCIISNCETAVSCVGTNYSIRLNQVTTDTGTTCLLVNGSGAVANLESLTTTGFTYGIDIGTTGGSVYGVAFVVRDTGSFTRHTRVQNAGSTLQLMPSVFRADKTEYNASSTIQTVFGSEVPGDEAYKVIGEFHVGSESRPKESAFGGGDSHTRGMVCYTNTNGEAGTWADITTQLRDYDASSANVFPAVGVDNCFYVGGDYQFPGTKVLVTTARSGGALVLEYWNGSAWTSIPHMSSDADSPYAQYAQDVFTRTSSEQIRFGITAGWSTKSLNGTTKYWIRWRITTALTTIPALDQCKVHTNRTEINSDGVVEYFGTAEPVRQVMWHRSLLEELTGFAQPDVDINIATNFTIKGLSNRWQDGAKDGSATFLQALPGLDTSRPLVYVVGWAPESTDTGNVELQLDVVTLVSGSVLDGTLPYTAQLAQITTGPFTAYTVEVTQFSFTVPDLTATGSLAMALYRDAGAGNLDDTFNGDAIHVYSAAYGTFWR